MSKINILEFISNHSLAIKCYTLEQSKVAGKYLWPKVNLNNWSCDASIFPIIIWYSSNSSCFNRLRDLKTNQKAYYFENIIFEDVSYKYLIPYINKL